MNRFIKLLTATLALFGFAPLCRAGDPKPVWRIDLHALQSERPHDELTVKFSGPYLVVYSGYEVYSGPNLVWVRPPRLDFDAKAGHISPGDRPAELSFRLGMTAPERVLVSRIRPPTSSIAGSK